MIKMLISPSHSQMNVQIHLSNLCLKYTTSLFSQHVVTGNFELCGAGL